VDDRGRSQGGPSVVGREAERARLDHFVREARSGSSIVLIGAPGIGKTTLWEAAVCAARDRGGCVLAARPGDSAARLPFAGLIDLCDHLDEADFASLPIVQRRALEEALLRTEPAGGPGAVHLVTLALLGIVRALAARGSVVVAIDDLQWLDGPSADAVAFLARRLEDGRVTFLLARRPGPVGSLEAVLSRAVVERLQVGPLSFGAVRRLLFERLGLTTSRQRLRQVVDATAGNPLFALEVGRALLDDPERWVTDDLPLPGSLEEMLSEHVSRLVPVVQRVLLMAALSGDLRIDQVLSIVEADALDDAVRAGVVAVDGHRMRPAHPLLATAAETRASPSERREVHLALSRVALEESARVMHLALASVGPDRALAARVAAEAEAARARGSRREASLLATQALRLTPEDAPERVERVLELAERLDDTGELRRMSVLLREALPSLPAGTPRARALLALSEGEDVRSREDQDRYLDQALGECGGDRNLRARLLAKKAGHAAAAGVSQLGRAEAWAREALTLATDQPVRRYALYSLAWPLGLRGRPLDDLAAQSGAITDVSAYLSASPERVLAKRLFWRGELARARELLRSLQALADDRGDLTSYAMIRMHMVEVELRAGDLAAAASLLDEWGESSDYETQFRPQYPRCRALLEVQRGAGQEAQRWADETIGLAQAAGSMWDELEGRRARGINGLLGLVPDRAAMDLWVVWEHCEREGVLDPGAFPVAPDLVEALSELERFEDAGEVARRLGELAAQQDHPWARATFKRCAGVLELATGGDVEVGAASLAEAAADLEALGSRFDAARCLLALGRAQRRLKQWRGAREALERAANSFAALGGDGWVARATSELERVGGRRRAGSELTPSERQVSELAAEGLSNKQIAAALYVTVNTVEVHLARAYAKLGVRSRAQLAKRLAAGS
jgi:DNA-binding CsgD family transcriptional regulator/energy-coupling factor transporter ATP-binding protein EcfA2